MTQQYLVGELSLLLGQLHTAMANEASAVEVARLRQRAETGPPSGLASVVMRALEVADCVCSDSLTRGDAAAFVRQASIGAELWEFAVGAGLLEERWYSTPTPAEAAPLPSTGGEDSNRRPADHESGKAGQLRVEMGEGPGQGVHTALSSATYLRTPLGLVPLLQD